MESRRALLFLFILYGGGLVSSNRLSNSPASVNEVFVHLIRYVLRVIPLLGVFAQPGKPPRPVRSVETGLVFPSVSAAARCMMLYGSQNIHQAMRNGTKAAGLHWEYVDPEEYKVAQEKQGTVYY